LTKGHDSPVNTEDSWSHSLTQTLFHHSS